MVAMKNLIFLLLILVCLACTKHPEQDVAFEVDMPLATANKGGQESEPVQLKEQSRKLIKEGYLKFESQNPDQTRSRILAAASVHKAYIASEQENKDSDVKTYEMIIRIPADQFDAFISSATKDVDNFEVKQIKVKDVTGEFTDNQARLKTKRELELRYTQLLSKASNVKDILEIEKELGAVREEIESAEGMLNLMKDQVGYSTLTISFYKAVSTPSLFSAQVKSAFVTGWGNLQSFVVLLVNLWPFLLLAAGLWLGLIKWQRRKVSLKSDSQADKDLTN